MKCDGLRPTCKNCQKKNVVCHYIPVVRRRGPGKKQKAIDARPKKTNKRLKSDEQHDKGKGRADDFQLMEGRRSDEGTPPRASGSGVRHDSPLKIGRAHV